MQYLLLPHGAADPITFAGKTHSSQDRAHDNGQIAVCERTSTRLVEVVSPTRLPRLSCILPSQFKSGSFQIYSCSVQIYSCSFTVIFADQKSVLLSTSDCAAPFILPELSQQSAVHWHKHRLKQDFRKLTGSSKATEKDFPQNHHRI